MCVRMFCRTFLRILKVEAISYVCLFCSSQQFPFNKPLNLVVNDLPEPRVDGVRTVIEVGGLLTGQSVQGERTNKVQLIENSLVGADEAPLEHLLLTVGILYWVTNMENLAFIGDIG